MQKLKIKSIKSLGIKKVVDIEMPTKNNFILSNGVVAHNCIHSIGYATITYATAFLKAHYPLEWWASILSNADSKEIKEKYWKHSRHLILPPDINLSTEQMVVDYNTNKIRNKLSVVAGLSEAGVANIMSGRPYKNLQDLVNKKTITDSLMRKLMHVGVLDSLLKDPKASLITKMSQLEDAIKQRAYNQKLIDFEQKNKVYEEKKNSGLKATKPKAPPEPTPSMPDPYYLSLGPYEDLIVKKSIMPSVEANLTELFSKVSSLSSGSGKGRNITEPDRGNTFPLVDGSTMEIMDKEGLVMKKDKLYYACAGIVVDMKEFSYKKGKSTALKLLVDTDNYLREVVIWPDYDTGLLSYPDTLLKGSIIAMYYMRRNDKPSPKLLKIEVEYSSKK